MTAGPPPRTHLVGLLAVLLSAGLAAAGPITTNTALPVAEGQIIVRGQVKLFRATGDPRGAGRERTVWAFPTVLVYGVTERLAMFAIVPYLDKRLKIATGGPSRGDAGLGDVTLMARYTVSQRDRPGDTQRLAPFAGLKMPTGRSDQSDSLGLLPRPLQLGSGSWDPVAGVVFTWQTLAWEFDTSASYQASAPATGFRAGDTARFDVSWQRRLLPEELSSDVPGFLYGVIEGNLVWRGRNRLNGATDPDSGGLTWYLAPGLQWVTRRAVVEMAVQIPVVQSLGGTALEEDFIVNAGVRANF